MSLGRLNCWCVARMITSAYVSQVAGQSEERIMREKEKKCVLVLERVRDMHA